jgi:hypothetical protein
MELMARLWSPSLKDDPLAFVLYTFPWGQAGTPLEHFPGPRKWQRQILADLRDHIKENQGKIDFSTFRESVASGRGIGKSALVSWLVIWMLSSRIGSTTIVSANSEAQLRSVTWAEITKWLAMSLNSHWFEIAATRIMPAKWLTELVERDLKKGTRYWSVEGRLWSEENPDAYAGVHNFDGVMLIFDEASGIPDSIWSVEYGPDSYQASVEVYGNFPSEGDDQFIGSNLVDDAMKRPPIKDDSAPIVIGVDPARFGADATVIAIRQGRDILELRRHRGADTMEVAGYVIDAIEQFKPALVCIDEGGLGAGVVDRLKEQRYKIRGVNFGNKAKNQIMWGNKRAEMWGAMRDWLRTGHLPTDRFLKTDLISPRTKPDSKGTLFLESKKDMKSRGLASPDAADAIAVTFAFPVASQDFRQGRVDRRSPSRYSSAGVSTSWMGS